MRIVYIMIGIPGSGKSTIAKQISEESGAIILSSDAIRKELFGDENIQGNPSKVFNAMHERLIHGLEMGHDLIYDATNLSAQRRKELVELIKTYDNATVIYIWCKTDLRECIERQALRARKVPASVIRRMYYSLEEPTPDEGYTELIIK